MTDEEKMAWANVVHAAGRPVMMDCSRSPNQRAILAADAELTRLRAIVAQVEDVEEIRLHLKVAVQRWPDDAYRAARAVREYLLGKSDASM